MRLLDADGEELASAFAELSATSLPPGTSANFVARFPGVFTYADVAFEPDGFLVASQSGPEPSVPGAAARSGGRR